MPWPLPDSPAAGHWNFSPAHRAATQNRPHSARINYRTTPRRSFHFRFLLKYASYSFSVVYFSWQELLDRLTKAMSDFFKAFNNSFLIQFNSVSEFFFMLN